MGFRVVTPGSVHILLESSHNLLGRGPKARFIFGPLEHDERPQPSKSRTGSYLWKPRVLALVREGTNWKLEKMSLESVGDEINEAWSAGRVIMMEPAIKINDIEALGEFVHPCVPATVFSNISTLLIPSSPCLGILLLLWLV